MSRGFSLLWQPSDCITVFIDIVILLLSVNKYDNDDDDDDVYVRVGDDQNWLYSSHVQMSTCAACSHAGAPCRQIVYCPSCQQQCGYSHYYPACHHPPDPSHDSAVALLPAVQKNDPVRPEPDSADREQFPEEDESFPAEADSMLCVTCDLDYYVVEYVMKSQKHRVSAIEQEFGVTVKSVNRVCDEIVTVAFHRYNPMIQPENEEMAHRAFLALYEVVYQRIVQRTVQAKIQAPSTLEGLLSAINTAYKDNVFASINSDGVFTLVGPFQEVSMVEEYIRKRINAKPSAGHPHTRDDGKFHPDDEGEEDGTAEGESMSEFEVGGRAKVKVKVYSADITHLPVDVIVNAANERLQNYAGVAEAIERAGGEELKKDCEAIVEQGGPIKV